MDFPLQITWRNVARSEALDERLRAKAEELAHFHRRITSCHIVVERVDGRQHQGQRFRVAVDVRVPGHEIVVDHNEDEDIYVAARDAFGAAARRLEDVARIDRGDVKAHLPPRQE